ADRDGEVKLVAHGGAQPLSGVARAAVQALGTGEVEEGLVEREALDGGREAPEDREDLARHRGVAHHVAAQEDPVGTEPARLVARHRRVDAVPPPFVAPPPPPTPPPTSPHHPHPPPH